MKKGRTDKQHGLLFIMYICVQVLIFVDAGTGSALEFTKRSEGQTFRKIYSISVGDCLKQCEQRPTCVSVNYHRRKLTCDLHEFDGATVPAVSEHQPGFVYARKDPLQATLVCGSEMCTLNQKCDEEISSCVSKATCKVRKQMTSTLSSGEFEFTDTETKEKMNIFCDFYNGYGHTFISKQDFGKLSNLAVHYTRTDYVILRHIRRDKVQNETKVAVLPAYSTQYNVTVMLNSSADFSSPRQRDTHGPFILVGFVPNSFGTKKSTTHGYACNDEKLSYNNCDGNNNNYFVVYSGSNNNNLGQYDINPDIAFGWATSGISIAGERYLPGAFFGLFEMGMGGCGAFISQDKERGQSTVTGVAVGVRFDL